MSVDTMISIKDLGLIALWAALFVMILYLILLFKRLNDTVKGVNRLIEENREDLGKTMKEVPEITRNINSLTTEANNSVQAVKGIVKNVGVLKKAAATASGGKPRKKAKKRTVDSGKKE